MLITIRQVPELQASSLIAPLSRVMERDLVQCACSSIHRAVGRLEGDATAGFLGLEEPFEGRHLDREMIVSCGR